MVRGISRRGAEYAEKENCKLQNANYQLPIFNLQFAICNLQSLP